MKFLSLIAMVLITNTRYTMAQEINFDKAKSFLEVFKNKIEIPKEYNLYFVKKVKVDSVFAYLFRYQKDLKHQLGEEHFSFIISEKEKQILGFTNLDRKYANQNMLSKSQTEEIARNFLNKIDANLSKNLKNLWIEKHDEEVIIGKEKMIVSGMKYKCFNDSNNDYAWVIVGFDGSVITFERNIIWDNNAHKRITEKWLHDNWLKNQQ